MDKFCERVPVIVQFGIRTADFPRIWKRKISYGTVVLPSCASTPRLLESCSLHQKLRSHQEVAPQFLVLSHISLPVCGTNNTASN